MIPAPTDQPDTALVAMSPAELPAAQQALAAWCDHKIAALLAESKECDDHRLIAQTHGWKMGSLTARINLLARRVTYYEKLKAAVDAGYLIVPNMPIDVLAVRVKRAAPGPKKAGRHWTPRTEQQLLPAGQGRYVDDTLAAARDESYETPDGKGGMKKVEYFVADEYDEPDFPWAAVKPVVMDATARAMALKVFDQIGMVRNDGGRDPIMVGRLLDPRGGWRCATFFLAWWLNPADL